MSNLVNLSIDEALEGFRSKKFSVRELITACVDHSKKHTDLNVYITDTFESALNCADKADATYASGTNRKLEGIPLGVKDLFCTNGVRTTAGSKMLENFVPTYDSTVSANALNSGMIMMGKTNMDEFAMGSSNLTSYFGGVISPCKAEDSDELLVPGGSSGGSAAVVAANMAMASLGSDTGGSVRQPAAFTGLVGVKPTYGRCSRYGMVAFASSLDQAGVFAKNVKDASLVLESIMGFDNKDSTSLDMPIQEVSQKCGDSIKGRKIGVPLDMMEYDGISADVLKMWQESMDWVRDAGAEIVNIKLPNAKHALPVYYIIAPAEASSNLARYDGVRYGLRVDQDGMSHDDLYALTRSAGFGNEVKRRIVTGVFVLSSGFVDAYYIKAQKVRRLISNDFKNALKDHGASAILLPSAPTAAFPLNCKQDDPVLMYLNDIFTIPASLAGLPAMSVPAGVSTKSGEKGLPLGMQIVSHHCDELTMLQVASAIESRCPYSFAVKNYQ